MPDPRRAAANVADDEHPLAVAYRADVEATGRPMVAARTYGARCFIRQIGFPKAWEALDVDAQLALPARIRQFVLWLVLTGRARATPDYLLRSRAGIGHAAALLLPSQRDRIFNGAVGLGFQTSTGFDI